MKSNLLNTLVLAALVLPAVAMADTAPAPAPTPDNVVTTNVNLVSNYVYRGISQTGGKPAIQGGLDYSHVSGFYAGMWGSNISWLSDSKTAANASLGLDTYLGFKNSFATDYSYDVGFLRYNYPGTYAPATTTGDTNEIYGLIGWKWLTAKYSYSLGSTFGLPNASGTSYFDLSANYAIPDTTYTLGAHYGKQTYKGSTANLDAAAGADPTYSDYKLSVAKDLGTGYGVSLTYSKTNATTGVGTFYNVLGKDLGKGAAVLALSRTF